MYYHPSELQPGRDKLVMDDGTKRDVQAVYRLGDRWAIETPGQIVQASDTERVRAQRPA